MPRGLLVAVVYVLCGLDAVMAVSTNGERVIDDSSDATVVGQRHLLFQQAVRFPSQPVSVVDESLPLYAGGWAGELGRGANNLMSLLWDTERLPIAKLEDYSELFSSSSRIVSFAAPVAAVAGLALALAIVYAVAYPTFFLCRRYTSDHIDGQGWCGGNRPRPRGYTRREIQLAFWSLLLLTAAAFVFATIGLGYNTDTSNNVSYARDGIEGIFSDVSSFVNNADTSIVTMGRLYASSADTVVSLLNTLPLFSADGPLAPFMEPTSNLIAAGEQLQATTNTSQESLTRLTNDLMPSLNNSLILLTALSSAFGDRLALLANNTSDNATLAVLEQATSTLRHPSIPFTSDNLSSSRMSLNALSLPLAQLDITPIGPLHTNLTLARDALAHPIATALTNLTTALHRALDTASFISATADVSQQLDQLRTQVDDISGDTLDTYDEYSRYEQYRFYACAVVFVATLLSFAYAACDTVRYRDGGPGCLVHACFLLSIAVWILFAAHWSVGAVSNESCRVYAPLLTRNVSFTTTGNASAIPINLLHLIDACAADTSVLDTPVNSAGDTLLDALALHNANSDALALLRPTANYSRLFNTSSLIESHFAAITLTPLNNTALDTAPFLAVLLNASALSAHPALHHPLWPTLASATDHARLTASLRNASASLVSLASTTTDAQLQTNLTAFLADLDASLMPLYTSLQHNATDLLDAHTALNDTLSALTRTTDDQQLLTLTGSFLTNHSASLVPAHAVAFVASLVTVRLSALHSAVSSILARSLACGLLNADVYYLAGVVCDSLNVSISVVWFCLFILAVVYFLAIVCGVRAEKRLPNRHIGNPMEGYTFAAFLALSDEPYIVQLREQQRRRARTAGVANHWKGLRAAQVHPSLSSLSTRSASESTAWDESIDVDRGTQLLYERAQREFDMEMLQEKETLQRQQHPVLDARSSSMTTMPPRHWPLPGQVLHVTEPTAIVWDPPVSTIGRQRDASFTRDGELITVPAHRQKTPQDDVALSALSSRRHTLTQLSESDGSAVLPYRPKLHETELESRYDSVLESSAGELDQLLAAEHTELDRPNNNESVL